MASFRSGIQCTAFHGVTRVASGALRSVASRAKRFSDRRTREPLLIFDDSSGEQIEVDFRGSAKEVLRRLETTPPEGVANASVQAKTPSGPGRPRLGVVAREVTLLPRHWEWLNCQPGGASMALRKLVEEARRANKGKDRVRAAQESGYRFMSAMAGNEAGFEEAARALFAGDAARFEDETESWPRDVREHARKLARVAFSFSEVEQGH